MGDDKCEACGRRHGSPTVEMRCLEQELRVERGQLARVKRELEALRAGVRRLHEQGA